jgi:type II secretory pathway pseudopilin PulG
MNRCHKTAGRQSRRYREHGQTILIVLVLLIMAGAGGVFVLYSSSTQTHQAAQTNAKVLAEAKEALIGRGVTATTRPGSLPCPDTDNDGLENWNVTGTDCASNIGRLPWMTLGLPDLRDASGERLWYALSPNFRDHFLVQPLNSDSVGQITITGTSPGSSILAIIFAPGEMRPGQVRNAANQNNVVNYLEGENNNGDLIFTTALASNTFNDRLLAITSDNLFSAVTARVAGEVRLALEQYRTANGYYPFANNYTAGTPYVCENNLQDGRIPLSIAAGCGTLADWAGQLPSWFAANNWNLVTHYGMDNACALTVTGATTTGCTVVIVTGRAVNTQIHPCANAANCVDDAENANGDTVYVKPSRYPIGNDRMAVKCAAATPCL